MTIAPSPLRSTMGNRLDHEIPVGMSSAVMALRNIAALFEKAFSLCYDPPHGCIHHGKAR